MSYGDSLGHRRSYGLLFVVEQCSGRDIAINSPISASRSAGLRYWALFVLLCRDTRTAPRYLVRYWSMRYCVDGGLRDESSIEEMLTPGSKVL